MRFAINGQRSGSTFHVGGRFVTTNPTDGGAAFTEAQTEELKKRGYTLKRVADHTPKTAEEEKNAEAQAAIASNRAAAEENNAKMNRAPGKGDKK